MSQPPAKELRRANIDGHLWLELVMLPPNAMAGAKYYACQGKPSTAVMPANFEANVIGVLPRTASPPQPAETHEQAMQRLAAAQIALKAAQQAKDTAAQNLAAARREDDAATQELERASAALQNAETAVEAVKPKPKVHAVAKDDIDICMTHGSRTDSGVETSWTLADIKVTRAKTKDALPVGQIMKVEKLSSGGIANLQFEPEELRKDRTFTGVISSIKDPIDGKHKFGFILASVGDRRGSVYVDVGLIPAAKQGQVVRFGVEKYEHRSAEKIKAVNMEIIGEGSARLQPRPPKPTTAAATTTTTTTSSAPQAAAAVHPPQANAHGGHAARAAAPAAAPQSASLPQTTKPSGQSPRGSKTASKTSK